jgi:hypothetical protein
VRVPETPEVLSPGVDKYESNLPPLMSESRFVRVGDDVQAARYSIKMPYGGSGNIRSAPGIRSEEGNTPPPGEPVDPAHHVGPMETFESLVANETPGIQNIFWENRGRPEYRTQYDLPAPDVAVHAELTVKKYAVAIKKADGDAITLTNQLADIEGRAELYAASLHTDQIEGSGSHAAGELDRTLTATDTFQWRIRITPNAALTGPADVYVLNMSGKEGPVVTAQEEITPTGATLIVGKPKAGLWKILVRSRKAGSAPITYTVHEALLHASDVPLETMDAPHASGSSWTVPLPANAGDPLYAGFRIAGTPGEAKEKHGLLIGLTPLGTDGL